MTQVCTVSIAVFIVQPGLARAHASPEQLQLLGCTANYLAETFQIELGVIGSAQRIGYLGFANA